MFPCLTSRWGATLGSHLTTPGCKKKKKKKHHQLTGTCAASSPQMERLSTHTHTHECRWFMGEPWQHGHNRQKCICGTAWRLNGTKWAIIQNSMLGPELKRGFPWPVEQEDWGEGAVPHLPPLMVCLQVVSPPPFCLPRPPPCGFFLFLLFLLLPARTYSHTVTRKNLGPFLSWLGPLFRHKDTKQLYGTGRGLSRG